MRTEDEEPVSDDLASASDARLDELVPAPWTTARRVAIFVVVACAFAAVVVLVRSGYVGPQLSHDNSWGSSSERTDDGTIVAERLVQLRNDGWVGTEVESLELPAIDGVRWRTSEDLPLTLQPGEVAEFSVPFTVSGCDLDPGGFDVFPVRARSGLAPSRVVEVSPPSSTDPSSLASHADDGYSVPVWRDHEPSWIFEVIAPACTTSPDGRGD